MDQRDRQAHARWVVTMQGSATVRTSGIYSCTNQQRNGNEYLLYQRGPFTELIHFTTILGMQGCQ